MLRILPAVLLIALVVYALIDCVRTPDDDMPVGIPKVLWVVLIIVFPGIAAIAWIVVSRVARATAEPSPSNRPGLWSSPSPQRPVRRTGPLAPDDDPEFLARLESERRRAARERRQEIGGDGAPHEIGPGDDGGAASPRPGLPASETSGTTSDPASSGEPSPSAGPAGRPAEQEHREHTESMPQDEGTSEGGASPSSGASQS